MNIRHFEILNAVAQTGNFTKAAETLYLTQSAISHAIKELEDRAGTALFYRMPKGVQLTKCGQLLLDEALPLLSSFQSLESHITDLESRAPLHIVSCITIASFWLPGILHSFQERWSNLSVHVDVMSAANAAEVLKEGKTDLALLEGTCPDGPFCCLPFSSYRLQAVCSPDYPISSSTLSVSAFCAQKLLLREKGSAVRDCLDSALYLNGHTLYPVWTSVNSQALLEAAKSCLGIAVLPDILVSDSITRGDLIPVTVEHLSLENELLAVFRKNQYLTQPLQDLLRYSLGVHPTTDRKTEEK